MGNSTVSCAKTAERSGMPFGTKTRVGQRNHCIWRCLLRGWVRGHKESVLAVPQGEGAI